MDDVEAPVHVENNHAGLYVDAGVLEQLARRVVDGEGGTLRFLSIVLTDHPTVLELNRAYLAHDYHTDVLSFDLGEPDEPDVVDGEVYVDLDTAAERHVEFGTTFDEEVCRYVVHGILHLLGYDDATEAGKAAMHAREDAYLRPPR